MVKFAVEFWWKMLLTIFPSKRSSKISFQTSPEVRHQFRRKLRQLHSGNRWCLCEAYVQTSDPDKLASLMWVDEHQDWVASSRCSTSQKLKVLSELLYRCDLRAGDTPGKTHPRRGCIQSVCKCLPTIVTELTC